MRTRYRSHDGKLDPSKDRPALSLGSRAVWLFIGSWPGQVACLRGGGVFRLRSDEGHWAEATLCRHGHDDPVAGAGSCGCAWRSSRLNICLLKHYTKHVRAKVKFNS